MILSVKIYCSDPRKGTLTRRTKARRPLPAIEIGCCRFRSFFMCRSRVNPTSVGERWPRTAKPLRESDSRKRGGQGSGPKRLPRCTVLCRRGGFFRYRLAHPALDHVGDLVGVLLQHHHVAVTMDAHGAEIEPGRVHAGLLLRFGNELFDLIDYGEVIASSIIDGGSGYQVGNTGAFNENNTNGRYTVTGVDGGGAVTLYTLGTGDEVVNGATVGQTLTSWVNTGAGDGNFSIRADAIAPGNGTGRVTVVYQVIDLP
jgi:hypothetical protein